MSFARKAISSTVSMAMAAGLLIGATAATAAVNIATAAPAQAANNAITLNTGGGDGPGKGIKIQYQGGKYQVTRDGSGQIYSPRSPADSTFSQTSLAVLDLDGDGKVKPATSKYFSSRCASGQVGCLPFSSIDTTGSNTTGSGTFSSVLSGSLDGRTYSVKIDVNYIYPNDYFTQTYTVTIPEGNTKTVRLYNGYDTYLEGGDAGPGFYNSSPQQVGVKKTAIEALQYVSGQTWEGYFSGRYTTALNQPATGNKYDDTIDPNAGTDNGIAVNYNFGSTPGTKAPTSNFFIFVTTGSPNSPTNVTSEPAPESLVVSWDHPADGPTPSSYTATANVPGSSQGYSCTADYPATSCTIPGLDPNEEYEVTVTASNNAGSGLPSTPTPPVQPEAPAPPGPPGKPTAQATGTGAVSVTVIPPTTGGTPDTYTIQAFQNGVPVEGKTCEVQRGDDPLACTVDGLDPNLEYTFEVTATNGEGSATSAQSDPVRANVPPGAPGKPNVSVTALKQITIDVAPSTTGGAAESYTVQAFKNGQAVDGKTCTVNADVSPLQCPIGDLEFDTPYTFSVIAHNEMGDSTRSPPSVGIIPGPPSGIPAPAGEAVAPGVVNVIAQPATGGGPANYFEIQAFDEAGNNPIEGAVCSVDAGTDPLACEISGLDTHTPYTFKTKGFNGAGPSADYSPASAPVVANVPPSAPGTPTAQVAGNGQVKVNIQPSTQGGAADEYIVRAYNSEGGIAGTCDVPANANPLTCTIQGLDATKSYTFKTFATNNAGNSPASPASNSVVPGPPSAPTAPTVTVTEIGKIKVRVNPTDTGGTIQSYTIKAFPGPKTCTIPANADPLECEFTGLDPNVQYYFKSFATNVAGNSAQSPQSESTYPNLLPGVPAAPHANVAADGSVKIDVAPSTSGGTATSYVVKAYDNGVLVGGKQCTVQASANPLTCTIAGLDPSKSYTFTTEAVNNMGHTAPSAQSNAVTPAGQLAKPDAPSVVATSPGVVKVTVNPADEGGTPSQYVITAQPGGATCTVAATANPLTCDIAGLNPQTQYTFTTVAKNAMGQSQPSDSSSSIFANTVPSAPGKPKAVVSGPDQVDIAIAPSTQGGAAASYTVKSVQDPTKTCTVAANANPLKCSITGLPDGDNATFIVVANNNAGTSPASVPSSPIRPGGPDAPGAPGVVINQPGKAVVTVTNPPTTGGTPSSYQIQAFDGVNPISGKVCTVSATVTPLSCVIDGLNIDGEVTFHARSVNADNTSGWSPPSDEVVPNIPPAAPTNAVANVGTDSAVVYFQPVDTAGAPTSYTVQAFVDGEPVDGLSCLVNPPFSGTPSCEVEGLVPGSDYTFQVRGNNSAGPGGWSQPTDEATPGTPGKPGRPQAVLTDEPGQITVEIVPPTDGGTPFTYTVTAVEDPDVTCTVQATASPLECVFSDLADDQSYSFFVIADNLAGPSQLSDSSAGVVPSGVPGKPGTPTVLVDEPGVVTVGFTVSESSVPVTNYVVQAFDGDTAILGLFCEVAANASPLECSIAGLNPDVSYNFKVSGNNSSGSGAWSNAAGPIYANVAPDVAGVPTPSVSGSGSVNVTVPPAIGGGAATSYTVEALDAAGQPLSPEVTCPIPNPAESMTCEITGLTPGTDYTFRYRANNSGGSSDWSDRSSVVDPAGAPSQLDNAPTLSTDQPGQITVTVDPDTSGNGGTPSDYVVTLFDSNGDEAGTCEVAVGTSPLACTITGPEGGLNVEEPYTATVTPRNDVDSEVAPSPGSAPGYANVAPDVAGVPTPSVSGSGSVNVTVPPAIGGGAATSYTVEALDAAGDPLSPPVTCTMPATADPLSCEITGLTPGTDYSFRYRADNSGGPSDWSDRSSVVDPAGAPSQLDNAPTLSTDQPGQITVTVDPDTAGNGGTPSDYVVTLFDSNGDEAGTCEVVVGTSPLACTITGPEGGLDVDEEYTATVTPRNGAGLADQASPPSAPGYANVAPNAPGTPTARVAEGDNAVAITVPPSTEGGAATSYVVEALVDGDPLSPPVTCPIPNPAESMTCVITGLIPGTNYTFRSRGVNSAGDGAWSEPSNVIGSGLPAKPGVPSANVLEPGVIRVTVDPSVGGGTPDGYRVTAQPGGATCEVAANAVPLACNVEGLSTAESYTFTVIAFNEAGNSVPSNPSNQELANRAPGTPGLPVPDVTGDGEVTITVPPSTEGGAATSYTVRALVDGEPVDPARECTITGSPLPQPLSCEITGLTPGVNYAFEARGENNAGDGGWSTDSVEVNPAGQPGQPGERQPVVDEPGTLDVTVVPPTTGGTPTDYVVNILNADNDVVDTCTLPFNADPLECGFTGLNPEEQYTVEVIAENGAGDSRRTVGPLYPNQLPDSPTAPHAVVSGDGEVTVTVTPTTGGGASTKYIVEALNAEGDPLSPSVVCVIDENPLPNPLTCVFDDLDSNLEYTFRVKGESSRGEGSWSPASNVVTPDGAPGSPTQAPEVVADEPGVVTVTVDPVTDGGTPDEYVVTAEPGGATCIISASANPLSCQISGLNPDESYTFSYDARNDAGTSENASPASEPIAPNTPPEQPPAPRAVVTDDGEVTVTVEPSAGGSDASSFTVQAYEDGVPVDGASCTVDAGDDPLSCVIEGLDPNTSYEFQAQGENSAGTSPMSDSSEPVIPGAPSTPNRPSVTPTAPGVVEVAVDPASGGGTPTDFTVVIRNEEGNIVPGATCTVQATADPLSCEITGLDPNQEYTAETIANNGAGPSNPSQPSPDFAPNIVPSAPGTPSAQGTGAGEVTVTVPPSTTGGTPTSYVVEALVDGSPLAPPVVCTISGNPLPASLTCVFDELSADTEYTFRAVAENSAGQSPSSAPSNAVTPDGIPGVPGQPSVVVTDSGEVTVTVDPPSTGGQVEQYTVRALDSNGNPVSGKTCTVNPDDDPLSCEIAGLNPNSRYTFEVVAENDFGASDASEPSAPVRPGPPSAPKRPTVTVPEPGTVEVTVDPANGGGTPTDYTITGIDEDGQPIFDPDGNPVACTIPANADPLSCQFTGLDPNTPVRFVSDAENGAGSSPNSAPSNPTVPNVVPGQPGTPTVEVDDEGVVTINIQPPSTGGVPDSYTVTAYPGGASCTIPATKVPLACQIEGLNPETDYVFTTVAENSAGSSAPSAPSNNAVPGGPAQPLAPQATPDGRGKAKIKVLPNGDGGTANEFIIRAVDQDGNVVPGATCTVSGSADPLECVISGLDPFEPYTFESRAQNGIGNTDWSARSAPIVPNVVPGAPAKPKVEVSGEGRATVTVTPPATGGLPGKYVIISEPDGKSCEILLGQTSCVVEGLDPSKSYSFKAIAENDEGNSESVPSDPVVPTRPSKPSAPTVAPGGDKQVVVTIPKNSSGGTPSRYEVTAQPGGAKCVVSADANPLRCVFSNLNPNQQYRFAVKAVNGAGDSVSSALSAAVNPGGKRVSKPNKVRDMKTSGKSTSAKRVVTWKRPTGINAKRPLNGYLLTVQVQGIPKILISKKLAAKTTKYTLTQKQLLNAATKMRGEANSLRFVIRLVAFNDAGSSPVSVNRITVKKPKSSSGKATATKPNKVRTISVSGKETSSKRVVSWTKPQGVTSKVPLTGYAVVVKLKDNKTAVIKKSLTAKTTELTLTTKELASALKQAGIKFDKKKVLDFLVEIRAINSVGKSGAVAKDVLVKLK